MGKKSKKTKQQKNTNGANTGVHKDPEVPPIKEIPRKELELLLLNRRYTKEMIQDWYQRFIQDFPDGTVDKDHFKRSFDAALKSSMDTVTYCQWIYRAFDVEHAKKITFTQMLVALSIRSKIPLDVKLQILYRMKTPIDDYADRKTWTQVINLAYDLLGVQNRAGDMSPKKRVSMVFSRISNVKNNTVHMKDFIEESLRDNVLLTLLDNFFVLK
ncbi:hypothetical protein ACOME3_010070 [Neoechinorhynchus agilis]